MRLGAKLLEEALKARTVALGYVWVHHLVHGGTTTIWMTMLSELYSAVAF